MERDYAYLRADYPGRLRLDDAGPARLRRGRRRDARRPRRKGEAVLEHGARAFIALLDDVEKFDLAGSSRAVPLG